MRDKTPEIAIVGAGPGGLAAGMLLASRGYRVNVYEQKPRVGGRTSQLELTASGIERGSWSQNELEVKDQHPATYRFDLGPTFFMMPGLLEELFQASFRSLHDYVQLIELDPLYRLQFGDVQFEPRRSRQHTREQIERLFPGNGEGYLRFMQEEEQKFAAVSPLLQRPFGSALDYVRPDVLRALPRLHALDTVYGRLSRFFTDERLKYAFSFQAKYLGMSPWECPGTFTMLSYMEHAFGLYHPIGGVNRLCEAMADVIREHGGHIHLETGVSRVLTTHGRAVGLRLTDGNEVRADHVVLNADFATAMNELFEPGTLRKYTPDKLRRKSYSCSTYMLYLGLNRRISLPHHTILFADDYKRNVQDMTRRMTVSTDASIYVHNPGVHDPTLAPEGKTALYVLMPVPNLGAAFDWRARAGEVRAQVLARLEREPELRGLSAAIEAEAALTPLGWQDEHGVYRGATFNLAHSLGQMMSMRPHNRFEEVERCWLVGGGTHPGSGLPTIFESARISARLLMEQDRAEGRYMAEPLPQPMAQGPLHQVFEGGFR